MESEKETIAIAFKILYEDIVNNPEKGIDINSIKYKKAKNFIHTLYNELDDGVVEFLGAFMLTNPGKKVKFEASKTELLGLNCFYVNNVRQLGFNRAGSIVRDEFMPYGKEKD